MTEQRENPTILLLYVGRRAREGESEARRYYQLEEADFKAGVVTMSAEGFPVERLFAAKVVASMGGMPGMVYRVESHPGDTTKIYPGTAQYAGTWPDKEQRAAWQITDSVEGQKIALTKKHKAAKADDAVLECLAPIRRAYQRARGMQKNLVLARAVQYITR